jgi:hypothetical protein
METIEHAMAEVLQRPTLKLALEQRSKFEGWLKIELSHALSPCAELVRIEQEYDSDAGSPRADLAVHTGANGGWHLIMLKTVNTSFRFLDVEPRTRPITNNIRGVIEDVEKLRSRPEDVAAYLLFTMFPVAADPEKRASQVEPYLARVQEAGGHFVIESFVPREHDWGIAWFLVMVEARRDPRMATRL